jgi:serine/threonine-protein kinase
MATPPRRTPDADLLADAERAERAGDFGAAATALRQHVERHTDDTRARLRFARVLAACGERVAARRALAPLEAGGAPPPELAIEVHKTMAELEEADGALEAASERWERVLADDVDDAQARAHLAAMRPAAPPLAPGPAETLVSPEGLETLRYRLLRELGRGATAAVYLASDEALGIEVALKVLHPQLAGPARSEARRRFFAEARVAAGVRHPGVIAIYDVDEIARALSMEYVAGGTLRARVRATGALAPPEVLETARSLFDALAYVHGRGIVHGDLKPSNLLLRAPGSVVLADFGAAELMESAAAGTGTAADSPAGTPLYLAPEQFQGAPASARTDLYAAGAILWEMATSRPLRSKQDLLRGVHDATLLPSEAAERMGPKLASLTLALIAVDPAARPRSAEEALASCT